MDFPPLAWPAELKEDSFILRDESLLPEQEKYLTIRNAREAAAAIRNMKTRAFGQLLTVCYAMLITARHAADLQGELGQAAEILEKSRPTFSFTTYTQMIVSWAREEIPGNARTRTEHVEKRILDFLGSIREMRLNRSRLAAGLLSDGDTVLTHCNTSGELLLTARECRSQGKNIRFLATETRPYFQGRLTAWEMSSEDFETELVPDNTAPSLLFSGECSRVITASDRCAQNGDIVNKVGTYQIARCAREAGVPFYVFVQEPGDAETGESIPIEFRNSSEMTEFRGSTVYPADTQVFYPAFDVTPGTYIDRYITFTDTLTLEDFREAYQTGNYSKSL